MDRFHDGLGPRRTPQRSTETGVMEPQQEVNDRHPEVPFAASFRLALRGLPAGRVGNPLEMRTRDEWLGEILRVGNDRSYY